MIQFILFFQQNTRDGASSVLEQIMGTSAFVVGIPLARLTVIVHPSLARTCKAKKTGRLRAKLKDDDDPLLQAAIHGASLRFQETFRPGKPTFFLSVMYSR